MTVKDTYKPYSLVTENDFDKLEELARQQAEAELAPSFSEAELKHTKETAYNDGYQTAVRDSLTKQEERIALNMEMLVSRFDTLISTQQAYEAIQQKETVLIAVSLVKKIMPTLIEKFGQNEVEELIKATLDRNIKVTELAIYTTSEISEALIGRLNPMIEEANYAHRVEFKTDDSLKTGDCIIRWENGGVSRIIDNVWDEITNNIAALLDEKDLSKIMDDIIKPDKIETTPSDTTEELNIDFEELGDIEPPKEITTEENNKKEGETS